MSVLNFANHQTKAYGNLDAEKGRGLVWKKETSLVDDVQRAVDDVVEFEGVICIREALEVERVVLTTSNTSR